MNNPLVSILMSNYNCEKFIKKTIESVLNQTYTNFEFIIVDDCSNDNSRNIINTFNDNRIKKYFLEENQHMCYGFNFCISKASGQYYARIDSDDYWEPTKLEKQVEFMEKNTSYGACFTLVNVIDENDKILSETESDRVLLFNVKNKEQHEWIRDFYFNGSCLCHPSVLIRKSVIDDVGNYNYALIQIQDYDMWVRIVKKYPIYVMMERLVNYRWFTSGQNASSPSSTTIIRSNYEFTHVISHYFDDLSDELFIKSFGNDFIRTGTTSPIELECEKAFLLLRPVFFGITHKIGGMERLIKLLQNDESRCILKEKYYVTQKNFYELSASPLYYQYDTLENDSYKNLFKAIVKKKLKKYPNLFSYLSNLYKRANRN